MCNSCNKKFNQKCDYTRHINRKFKCTDTTSQIKNDKKNSVQIKPVSPPQSEANYTKVLSDNNGIIEIIEKIVDKQTKVLRRSDKELIKELKKTNKESMMKISSLEEEVSCMKKVMVVNEKSNISLNVEGDMNINNAYQINLTAFGKEDTSFLTDKQCKQILLQGLRGVNKYVEMVHCNEEKPEYKNIYISNRKNKNANVLVYNGFDWKLCDQSYVDNLREKGIEFIEEQYEDLKKRKDVHPSIIKMAERFIDHLENDKDGKKRTKISEDLKILLYNNRPKIKNLLK